MFTLLYIVRHGETFDNVARIMQGQTQGQLNATGIEQARQTAIRLEGKPIDVFLSSDLLRSLHTCKIIAAAHGVHKIITTPLLRERNWGSFTGKYIPSLAHLNDPSLWPDDIESIEALKERAEAFLTWIAHEYPNKAVLAVGHGIINKAIQSVFYDKPMKEIMPMRNGEVRELIIERVSD